MNVVNISMPPCAKFTMRVDRQIMTSDRATAAKIMPWLTPPSARLKKRNISEPQIGVSQLLVRGEVRGRSGRDDATEVEHHRLVGDRQRASRILLDEDDGQ